MTEPTKEVRTEMDFTYAVDQQVSVNAFFDVEINGEVVKMQITSRYNSSAEKIVKTTKALIDAYTTLRAEYAKPQGAPVNTSSATDKKFEAKPISQNELPEGLPEGIECFKEDFDEIEITPQADNKATVTFFRDGMKFPVGAKINKWKNADVVQALNPLGEYDVTKAQKIRVAGSQYYSKGAEYIIAQGAHKGEKSNYKDLRLIVAKF